MFFYIYTHTQKCVREWFNEYTGPLLFPEKNYVPNRARPNFSKDHHPMCHLMLHRIFNPGANILTKKKKNGVKYTVKKKIVRKGVSHLQITFRETGKINSCSGSFLYSALPL